jgi:23S rRNA U2552 (ribose-2'-O)-methylase RlmE/FtsJ
MYHVNNSNNGKNCDDDSKNCGGNDGNDSSGKKLKMQNGPIIVKINNENIKKDNSEQYNITQAEGVPKPNIIFGNYNLLYSQKEKINQFENIFYKFRNITNDYELVGSNYIKVPNIDVISRAYFKLFEILNNFDIHDFDSNGKFIYVGLAESPGGFMQCVSDFRIKAKNNIKMNNEKNIFKKVNYHKKMNYYGYNNKTNYYGSNYGSNYDNYYYNNEPFYYNYYGANDYKNDYKNNYNYYPDKNYYCNYYDQNDKEFNSRNNYLNNDIFYGISLRSETEPQWSYKMNDYFNGNNIIINYGDNKFNDGNLLNPENIIAFINCVEGKADFITADGGIGIDNDGIITETYKEQIHLQLFFAEIVTAILLKEKGNFIIKMYDIFTLPTAQLIVILTMNFNSVYIVKPQTSRPANSERYIVCLDYIGVPPGKLHKMYSCLKKIYTKTTNLPTKDNDIYIHSFGSIEITEGIMNSILKANEMIYKPQIKTIEKTLKIINLSQINILDFKRKRQKRLKKQKKYAVEWCKKYDVPHF